MQAARLHKIGQPLLIEEIPKPNSGPGEVLVRVMACGICGSDLHIAVEGVTPTAFTPITLGHEPAGVVAAVGPDVKSVAIGDRVAVCPLLVCNECINCKRGNQQICLKRGCIGVHADGALAEYLVVPAENLLVLPPSISFEQGAIITDAVATPYHAIFATGRLVAGETVAVFGCGGLGIHGVRLARMGGASLVIAVDVRPSALRRALQAGADLAVNARDTNPVSEIREATGGIGVDLAVELVGEAQSISRAVEALRPGGRASVAGLGPDPITTLPPTEFVRSEVALLGSYGFTVREIGELVRLVDRGRLDLSDSVSLTLPLEKVNEGLRLLQDREADLVRIVLQPNV